MQYLTRLQILTAVLLSLLCSVFVVACSDSQPELKPIPTNGIILAFGDSLTYGTGTSKDYSYPSVLQSLTEREVINAGIPGETTNAAVLRLPGELNKYHPNLVIICLGGNDMLKKVPPATTRKNLAEMISMAQTMGIQVLLIAVPQPSITLTVPSYYSELAKQFNVPIVTDELADLLKNPQYKSDPIHLNQAGYEQFAEAIAELLAQQGAIRTANTLGEVK